jgi:hypothetical protein
MQPEVAALQRLHPDIELRFGSAFERYNYLERIAIAKAMGGQFVLSVMDLEDRQEYASANNISQQDVDTFMAQFPDELMDEESNRYTAGNIAEDSFAAYTLDALETVSHGEYQPVYISRYNNVMLRSREAYLEFGTDDGEEETDFFIKKFSQDPNTKKLTPLPLELPDYFTIGETVRKLDAIMILAGNIILANQ